MIEPKETVTLLAHALVLLGARNFSVIDMREGETPDMADERLAAEEEYQWTGLSESQQAAALNAAGQLVCQLLGEYGIHSCRICGCTEHDACEGGCSWVGANLCSTCAPPELVMP